MQTFLLALVLAQPPVAKSPPMAVVPPMAVQPVKIKNEYMDAYNSAIKQGKPLIVFVDCDDIAVPGAVVVAVERLDGYTGPTIIVSVPERGQMVLADEVGSGSSAKTIRQAAGLEVSRAAIPFDKSSGSSKRVRPDGETNRHGSWLGHDEQERLRRLWPKNVSSDGMVFYRQTQHSQRIAVTNDRPSLQWYHLGQHDYFGNAPTMFNPNTTKPEWAAPGGLYGVRGWKSYTAAYLPEDPKVWKQPLPIADGGMIPGYLWSYPVGSTFADLLVKDGRVFELRMREKRSDGWDSFVAYKDAENAPSGYHGAGKRCSECHDRGPGLSEQYGITTRGSDTVFSFNPFDER